MQLEPGWALTTSPARRVCRLRMDGVSPVVEDAVDAALDSAGVAVSDIFLDGWHETFAAFATILQREFWSAPRDPLGARGVGDFATEVLLLDQGATSEQ